MSLKAGRRGLNKRLVDAFGNFNGEAPSGEYYTKQQTDNKFETKTHVNNTFQKKTLEVPIEMLSGSKLTVEDALQGLNEEKFTYADNGVLGAKNLLPNNITSQTISGVTITVNADGSITANGTATAQINLSIVGRTWIYDLNKDVIISGSKDGTGTTYEVLLWDDTESVAYRSRDGVDAIVPVSSVYGHRMSASFMVRSGAVLDNVTVYPMLRLASDPDDTYVPYAKTNRELSDELTVEEITVMSLSTDIVINTSATRLYKYGKIVTGCLRFTVNAIPTDNHLVSIAKYPAGIMNFIGITNNTSAPNAQPVVLENGIISLFGIFTVETGRDLIIPMTFILD